MTTTASTGDMQPVSLEAIQRAMREIDLLPRNKEWMLIDPNGNMWKTEDVAKLMGVLATHHPLLRHPRTDVTPFEAYPFGAHKEGD